MKLIKSYSFTNQYYTWYNSNYNYGGIMQELKILSMDLKNSNNIFRCSRKMRSVEGRVESIFSWIQNDTATTKEPFSVIMLQGWDAQAIGSRLARHLNYRFYAASDNPSAILTLRDETKLHIAALGDVADFGNSVVIPTKEKDYLTLFSVMVTDSKKAKEFSDIFGKCVNPYSPSFSKYQIVGGTFSSRKDVDSITDNYHLMDLSLEEGDFSFYQRSFVHTILLSNAIGYTDVKKEDNLVKQMVLKNSPIGSRVSYK